MNNQLQRYFIGLALPAELSQQLVDFKWQLHTDNTDSLKPLVPHITLIHPSSLQDSPLEELLPKLRELAAPYFPLTIRFETIEAFECEVLYIKINSLELEELQSRLVHLLPPDAQATYRTKPYTPHITLVQVRPPHMLNVEALRQTARHEILLPQAGTIDSVSYFTQVRPREYVPHALK